MSRRFVSNLIVALGVAVTAPLALRAQARTPSPEPVNAWPDRFTLGGAFGGLSGAANLNTAGTADWRLGWIGSIDGTVWLQRNVGIRASGSWAQDSLRGAALPGRGRFNKFSYDAALVLRYPIQAGSATLSPYVLGGAGASACINSAPATPGPSSPVTSAPASSTGSGASGSARRVATSSISSTASASTRPSTTSRGRADSR